MSSIDPSIIVHEINTYPMEKPIRKKLFQVHLRKAVALKSEVEFFLKDGFIYAIPLTEWYLILFMFPRSNALLGFALILGI